MIQNLFKIIIFLILINNISAQEFIIGRVQYNGGGDWYADPTSLPNVLNELKNKFGFTSLKTINVKIKKQELYKTPFIYITGHGNIKLTNDEIKILKTFLENGGFLYIDDCYGLDKFIRKIIKKIFPEYKLTKLKFSNPIYHSYYNFDKGLPKVHKHDGIAPQGYGVYYKNRLVIFYSYNSDIGCGVEDKWVHNDPDKIRRQAMKMFINIIFYYLQSL